ncbi:MAG TPA: hypothetical protein VIE12_06765, partial [Actinomycetota bacterium]
MKARIERRSANTSSSPAEPEPDDGARADVRSGETRVLDRFAHAPTAVTTPATSITLLGTR